MIACKVTPNARKSECVGWELDEQGRRVLRVKLAAQPKEGEANEELVRFLAKYLGCAKGEISLQRGKASRTKMLSVPSKAAARLD